MKLKEKKRKSNGKKGANSTSPGRRAGPVPADESRRPESQYARSGEPGRDPGTAVPRSTIPPHGPRPAWRYSEADDEPKQTTGQPRRSGKGSRS